MEQKTFPLAGTPEGDDTGRARYAVRKQERRFNVVGPNQADRHYTVPPEQRLAGIPKLCRDGAYVIAKAPRLSGKTTWARALARTLRDERDDGCFAVLSVSFRPLGRPDLPRHEAPRLMIDILLAEAEAQLPPLLRPPPPPPSYDVRFVGNVLSSWARICSLPIVLLIDDIDNMPEPLVLRLLADLRATFDARPSAAPWSVVITSAAEIAQSLDIAVVHDLPGFDAHDIKTLCDQYAEETGQHFTENARKRLLELSSGHPWITNALCREITERQRPPHREPITELHVLLAQRQLLRVSH